MRFGAHARVSALAVTLAAMALRPVIGAANSVFTRGAATCHAVALTFDLCPVRQGPGFDRSLVHFLEERRIHATFFASGAWMASHDAELRELIAQPFFEIGTHGQEHAHLPTLTPEKQSAEIRGAVVTLGDRYGVHATLFRPPYGEYTPQTVLEAGSLGQTVVMWSVVSGDPDPKLPAAGIVDDVSSRLRNGSVVIFHANGRGWHTSETVPAVYARAIAKGFAFDTISELSRCAPSAGK